MPVRTREVKNVAEFIIALKADQDGAPTWFRGHVNSAWTLLPGIMRRNHGLSEVSSLARFKQSAAMLTDPLPTTPFDWTFLMQHYGVPTRLLDWTESPLVAMYFAVEEHERHADTEAAIWCLKPVLLNKNASIVDADEPMYIPSFDDDELKAYTAESLRTNRVELYPVASIATRNSPRIQAQMGTFTIHHKLKVAIENVGDSEHVTKYVIPAAARATLKSELNLLGLTRFNLFPELTSVGLILRDMMA
jgi:hypothetical protein